MQDFNKSPSASSVKWIADFLRTSSRPKGTQNVGIEVERLAIWNDGRPWKYADEKEDGRQGAHWLLEELSRLHGWQIILSQTKCPIGMTTPHGKVTLEPGSQVELSSNPLRNLILVKAELEKFEGKVSAITQPKGLVWLSLGVHPTIAQSETDIIPSPRYHIMDAYFPPRGKLGTTMMRRTASVQVNLDYSSESEAVEMLQASLVLAPLSYALSANSPFVNGKPSGVLSYRKVVWGDTDASRTGLFPQAFLPGFNFEQYAQFLVECPLMFAMDNSGTYVAMNGKTLSDIAQGNVDGVSETENNRLTAIQQLFTEARIKPGYIEVRSIDGQSPAIRYAMSAFWLGVLYNENVRKHALKYFAFGSIGELNQLWDSVNKNGLKAEWKGSRLDGIAKELLSSARSTLVDRGFREEALLEPLESIIRNLQSPAEQALEKFNGEWKRDMANVIKYCAIG